MVTNPGKMCLERNQLLNCRPTVQKFKISKIHCVRARPRSQPWVVGPKNSKRHVAERRSLCSKSVGDTVTRGTDLLNTTGFAFTNPPSASLQSVLLGIRWICSNEPQFNVSSYERHDLFAGYSCLLRSNHKCPIVCVLKRRAREIVVAVDDRESSACKIVAAYHHSRILS